MDMRRVVWVGILGALVGLSSSIEVSAQTSRPTRIKKATKKALKTERIRGLDWHSSLEAAMAANRKSKGKRRPIFFLRMLGEMKGKT